MKKISILTVALSMMLLQGCATLSRGAKDTLVVETDPTGANLELSNGMSGVSPTEFELSRKHPVVIKASKPGYQDAEITVTPEVVGNGVAGMAGNALIGGIIGIAVDASTGAMKDLKPNPVTIRLEPR